MVLFRIIILLTLLITPITYFLLFRKKIELFKGISSNKFLIVYIFLGLSITTLITAIFLENCESEAYVEVVEIIFFILSFGAVGFGLFFFKNILFSRE